MKHGYVWFINKTIIILLVCFEPKFDPNLTFDLIYLENYPDAFHSNIIFLTLLFKLNNMIYNKVMFCP